MAAASDFQVQQYATDRMRQRANQFRALKAAVEDDLAVIGDIYGNLTNNPTWKDVNTANPAHLLTPNDVLAYNTFAVAFREFFKVGGDGPTIAAGAAQWPVIQSACSIPVEMSK